MTAPAASTVRSPTVERPDGCRCPHIPEVVEPITGAIRCVCCGRELVLTCPGECGTTHVPESMRAARRQLRALVPGLRKHGPRTDEKPRRLGKTVRSYKDKPCDKCGLSFTPTGPRQVTCVRCKRGEIGAIPKQKTRVA